MTERKRQRRPTVAASHSFSSRHQRLPPSPPLAHTDSASSSSLMAAVRARYRDAVASLFGSRPRILNSPCFLSATLLDASRSIPSPPRSRKRRAVHVAAAPAVRKRARTTTTTTDTTATPTAAAAAAAADQVVPSRDAPHDAALIRSQPRCADALECTCADSMWNARGIGPKLMLRTAEELSERIIKLYGRAIDVETNEVDYASLQNSRDFHHYLVSVCKLRYFNPALLADHDRKAFFLNVYNSLMIHAIAVMSRPRSKYERISLFNIATYNIGGRLYSLDVIEHGILRSNRPGCGAFAQPTFSENDARLQCVLPAVDPRIHFALNCGAKSCPAVRFYNASTLDSTLDIATTSYLQDVHVDTQQRTVTLPKLFQWYRRDFSASGDLYEVIEWTLPYLDTEKRQQVDTLLHDKKQHSQSLKIVFAEYDWTINDRGAANS